MPRTALRFAYHGPSFDGYARQPDPELRTVEGALLAALHQVGAVADPTACDWRSGSRTDRGVSARENVATFDAVIPPQRVALALGARVPGLWALASMAVDAGFDPRKAAAREYRYFLPRSWVPQGVGAEDFAGVFGVFQGRHDFRAFARLEEGRDPMRTVEGIRIMSDDVADAWVVMVRGQSFLWQQVRRMVGAALAVARGEATLSTLQVALSHPAKAPDFGLAPAEPLVLWSVEFPSLTWPAGAGHHIVHGLQALRLDAAVRLRIAASHLDG